MLVESTWQRRPPGPWSGISSRAFLWLRGDEGTGRLLPRRLGAVPCIRGFVAGLPGAAAVVLAEVERLPGRRRGVVVAVVGAARSFSSSRQTSSGLTGSSAPSAAGACSFA